MLQGQTDAIVIGIDQDGKVLSAWLMLLSVTKVVEWHPLLEWYKQWSLFQSPR